MKEDIYISYPMTNYVEIMSSVAEQLTTTWQGNHFIVPPDIGNGIVEAYNFEGFSIALSIFQIHKTAVVERIYSSLEDYFVFDYALAGPVDSAKAEINKNFTQLLYGFNITTPSTVSQVAHTAGGKNQQLAILVNKTWLESFLEKELPPILQKPNEPLMILRVLKKDLMNSLNLLVNSSHKMRYRKQYLYGKCIEILATSLDEFYEENLELEQAPFHPEDVQVILQVAEFISTHIEQHLTIGMLSQKFNMNRDKLQNLFKSIFGRTIADYTRYIRMTRAILELKKGKSVSEVGYQMGYSNLSHFSKAFRKVHNINPSEVGKT